MQVKNGMLISNTLNRGDLKGPVVKGIVSDLEARANDAEGPVPQHHHVFIGNYLSCRCALRKGM